MAARLAVNGLPGTIVLAGTPALLREVVREESAEILAVVNQNLDVLGTAFPWACRPLSEADFDEWWVEEARKRLADGNRHWSIIVDGSIAGRVTAWATNVETVEFGFWIGEAFARRGLVRAAVAKLEGELKHAGVHGFEIHHRVGNHRCYAFATAAGYTRVGGSHRETDPGVPYTVWRKRVN